MKKPRKYIAAFIAGCFVAFLLTTVLLATTGPGQRVLLRIAASAASSGDVSVKIGHLDGSLFSNGRISSLSIADNQGIWVEIDGISFSWNPWGFIGGALEIDMLRVAKATISRMPKVKDKAATGKARQEGGGDLIIPPMRIDVFTVEETVFGETILGQRARLSASGRIEALSPADAIFGAIAVNDLDRPSHIKANVTYVAKADSLEIAATAKDEKGGVLSTLLDLDDSPGLRLTLNGAGPVDGWRGDWSLITGTDRLAGGALALDRDDAGLRIAAQANGELARFAPQRYAALLAGNTNMSAEARILDDGSYRLDSFKLDAPRMTAAAFGSLDLEKYRIEGQTELRLRKSDGAAPVSLTLAGGETIALDEAVAVITAKPDANGTALYAQIDTGRVALQGNSAERISFRLSARQPDEVNGLFESLDTILVSAAVEKAELADAAFKPTAGDRIILKFKGSKSGESLTIADAALSSDAGEASFKGRLDATGVEGVLSISIPDVRPFSRLAGRDLSGELRLSATGSAGFNGSLDLAVNGGAERFAAGADLLGQLFTGELTLGGKLAREQSGALIFDALTLNTNELHLAVNGGLGARSDSLKINGRVIELGRLIPSSSGALQIKATVDGEGEAQAITARLMADEATVRGKTLRNVIIRYEGRGGFDAQRGQFAAQGTIGGEPLTGIGDFAIGGSEQLAIRNFALALGENRITADAALPVSGEARGNARLQIADAGRLAPILGMAMDGRATLDAQISGMADAPTLSLKADADSLRIDTIQLNGLTATFDVADLLARPAISGSLAVKSLAAGKTRVAGITLTAKPDAERTALAIKTRVDDRWDVGGEAVVNLGDWQPYAALRNISIAGGAAKLAQDGQAELSAVDGGLKLDGLILAAGDGRVTANVTMDESLAGKVEIKTFPASFAALAMPGMEPRGVIDGAIDLAGSSNAPEIGYRLSWKNAFVSGALPPSFPPLNLSASGAFKDDDLIINGAATGANGLDLKVSGALRGVSAGGALDLKAKGNVPLALAEAFLASRGTRLTGRTAIDLAITGQTEQPAVSGRMTASGASVSDPESGLDLKDANLSARLSGKTLQIETLTAKSEKGGNLTASGNIGILESKKLPVDLQIRASALRFDDQRVAAGEIGGDVALKGSLNGQSTLSGTIDIARLDIQIPQSLPASVDALELKHMNAPAHIAAFQTQEEPESETHLPATIALSLDLRSANRIFVRGRGFDAQLGGSLQLLGSADKPRAVGEFTLERGRLAVLGRTLEFVSGSVNFSGDMDPVLNFLATTDVDGTRIEVMVSGQASNPKFSFSSNPELPEDEILALLLFNKSLDQLSPLQIAQLASEVSELTGLSGGPGVLGRLKSSVGIDTLNITTDEKGDAAVSAGSYLNENIFVGVEQGSSGDSSRVKVDLDITKNLKLRGETGADGESKLGVGVEWEY